MSSSVYRVMAVGMVLAMAMTACGSKAKSSGTPSSPGSSGGGNTASAPGVTATTVTIGSHQPLTGIAAPGYSEIAPASKAYFDYINAHGGINGRTINYTYLDDGYDPSRTQSDVRQLILQDHVFSIFNGLGTPTHSAAVSFINQEKVPDLFVASGCSCWNEATTRPETFGWQTDYIIEGKILGAYVAKNFVGKKVGVLYQNDDFGQDGLKGITLEVPSSSIVAKAGYLPTSPSLTSQIAELKAAGAQVVISFTVPAFTAIAELTGVAEGFHPQYVVSSVGSDAVTLNNLLKVFSKGAANGSLVNGLISDDYLPFPSDTANSWITLFQGIWNADPALKAVAPVFDGNVEFGMAVAYTFAQALQAAGQNPTRDSIVAAIENSHFAGPGLVPFRYSATVHAGYSGAEVGQLSGGVLKSLGPVEITDDSSGPITAYTTPQAAAPSTGIPSP